MVRLKMRGSNGTSAIVAACKLCALALVGLAVTAGVGRSGSPETAAATAIFAAPVGGTRDCATAAWPYMLAGCAAGEGEAARAARRVRLIPVDAGRTSALR